MHMHHFHPDDSYGECQHVWEDSYYKNTIRYDNSGLRFFRINLERKADAEVDTTEKKMS